MIAVADAQKAGGLLEGLGTDAGYGGQLNARAETAMFIAELDDFLGGAFVDAGDVAQQGPGSGVEVHADAVDAAFNHRLKRFVQMILIDVMLILADADGLGVELDQLGQRVLQAARDGDGSADGEVEIGELLARDFGGGIDGGARLVHHHAEDRREAFLLEKVADERVGLARSGAVADRDGPDVVFLDQGFQRTFRAGDVVLGLERVDDIVTEKLAGVVDDGDLAAGADAGVESEYGELARGRGEQQVLEILAKNLDGIGVGALLQFQADLRGDGTIEQTLPGVFGRQVQLRCPVAGPLVDLAVDEVEGTLRIEFDEEVEDVFGSRRGGWRACDARGSASPVRGSRSTS